MSWQILLAISIVFSSVAVLLQRVLLHRDKTDPIAYAILFEGLVGIMLACAAMINGFEFPDFDVYWLPILATLFFFGLGNIVYAKTLQIVDASIFSVLFATNTIWVMLGGVLLLNEQLGLSQVIGAGIILASVALLADRTGKFRVDKGLLMGLLCGVLYGFGIIGWVYVAKHAELVTWNAITFLIPSILILAIMPRTVRKMKPFLQKAVMGRILLLSTLVSISSVCLLNAFNNYKASVISPLIQAEVLLTVILAIIFLHERKNLKLKLVAAITCLCGIFLIIG